MTDENKIELSPLASAVMDAINPLIVAKKGTAWALRDILLASPAVRASAMVEVMRACDKDRWLIVTSQHGQAMAKLGLRWVTKADGKPDAMQRGKDAETVYYPNALEDCGADTIKADSKAKSAKAKADKVTKAAEQIEAAIEAERAKHADSVKVDASNAALVISDILHQFGHAFSSSQLAAIASQVKAQADTNSKAQANAKAEQDKARADAKALKAARLQADKAAATHNDAILGIAV